ncbi:LysR substrate-binding domain-containing protein [Pseudomonas sp. GD03842]|uniref:LysR substrate-binding domain-containing protein n=1 Tax=Pseudomonas sp. GD03842 TaxID=2975385 RepID=UPI0024493A4B|nr:LysR substrate-binding domain-containing protein [Pseudomonas sp. GD03842]MDH0748829.1 LysR substrate-binding domain-containing protein [Pseudomonas sp. GD03842]
MLEFSRTYTSKGITLNAYLDLDLLRTFVMIAETGALSRAADRVGRTQAAISMQVKRLEETVNQPLLLRTGRGVLLTAHGDRLLAHAQKILRAHDEAIAEMSGRGLSGHIRLGCPDDYAAVFLPPLLRDFAARHPQVLVEVYCAPTPRLLERLDDHLLDIAIISLPQNAASDAVIRYEPLVWVGARGSDAPQMTPLQLALSNPDTLDHQAAITSLEGIGRPFRLAYASQSLTGLIAVVRSGQAIAVLTQTAVPADLHVLPADSGLPVLPNVAIALKTDQRQPSSLVTALREHIRSALPYL